MVVEAVMRGGEDRAKYHKLERMEELEDSWRYEKNFVSVDFMRCPNAIVGAESIRQIALNR